MNGEIKAINFEFQNQASSDQWRIEQIDRLNARKDHPYSKFATGNSNTLKTATVKELVDFFQTNYSSNLMQLCLLGNTSLDTLESYARQYFTSIQNKNYSETIRWQLTSLSDSSCAGKERAYF